jgi:hypothetical protein
MSTRPGQFPTILLVCRAAVVGADEFSHRSRKINRRRLSFRCLAAWAGAICAIRIGLPYDGIMILERIDGNRAPNGGPWYNCNSREETSLREPLAPSRANAGRVIRPL